MTPRSTTTRPPRPRLWGRWPWIGAGQLDVDRIPGDAYAREDLKYWLASLPETTFALNLPPALVGGSGKHRIIVALARNDDRLYRAPVACVTIIAT